MSGFDKDWLALREPVDQRSRDTSLLHHATALLQEADTASVLDVGCGTGSTYRTLGAKLTRRVSWTLFDHDTCLLAEAERRHPSVGIRFINGDLNDVAALPTKGVDLVTASALFDLCSPAFIDRFVAKITDEPCALYAALNYDGDMDWSVEHPLDEAVTKAFNDHQQTDKGFGSSAGPEAWRVLIQTLEEHGFTVSTADSPWLMGRDDGELQRQFLEGVARAAAEAGELTSGALDEWHRFRIEAIAATGSLCRVGHKDVFGRP